MKRRGICVICVLVLCFFFITSAFTGTNTHLSTIKLEGYPADSDTEYLPEYIRQPNEIVDLMQDTQLHFFFHDGRIRSYYVHVPESYKPGIPTSLVIALHAGGSFALNMLLKTNLSSQADEHSFIIVYPNGVTRCNPFWRMWNGGYCCGVAYERNVDDVGYIRAIIDYLKSHYNIDPTRVYVTGHSNGAILA